MIKKKKIELEINQSDWIELNEVVDIKHLNYWKPDKHVVGPFEVVGFELKHLYRTSITYYHLLCLNTSQVIQVPKEAITKEVVE